MAKVNTAPFPQDPKMDFALCTAASTWTATPTAPVLIGTIGNEGGVLTKVEVNPLATSTAMNLLLFAEIPNNTAKNLIATKYAAATTVSATGSAWTTFSFDLSELRTRRFPPGTKLYAGITVANATGMLFCAEWTDYVTAVQ